MTDVNKRHEGKYTCVVSNGSGETVASAFLSVKPALASTDPMEAPPEEDDFYFSSKSPSAPWVLQVVNSTCLELAWIAPQHPGSLNLMYQVEKYG